VLVLVHVFDLDAAEEQHDGQDAHARV
jgi:hypothetical protein